MEVVWCMLETYSGCVQGMFRCVWSVLRACSESVSRYSGSVLEVFLEAFLGCTKVYREYISNVLKVYWDVPGVN